MSVAATETEETETEETEKTEETEINTEKRRNRGSVTLFSVLISAPSLLSLHSRNDRTFETTV
jgi:hypothetical protein